MMHKCRFPGCTAELQTPHGRKMHETICHGISQEWMVETVFAQIQALDTLSEVDVPEDHLIAYTQDLVVIGEAVSSMENCCCS